MCGRGCGRGMNLLAHAAQPNLHSNTPLPQCLQVSTAAVACAAQVVLTAATDTSVTGEGAGRDGLPGVVVIELSRVSSGEC